MKFIASIALIAFAATAAHADAVVELFTSQGCSSCPPADAVLSELDERDDTIVLSWHVDYWDRLGWKDPFSSPEHSKRQRDYGRTFRLRSIYTPQMIVNGRREFVGSDAARARSELARAEALPLDLRLTDVRLRNAELRARVAVSGEPPEGYRLLALIAEYGLTTETIPRGENRGRSLRHDGVVRLAAEVEPMPNEFAFQIDNTWNPQACRLVVLAERGSGKGILGAVSLDLQPLAD